MAVSAPGDMPDPSQVDPGMWARLLNYLNPVSPAAADTLTQGPNPLNNPSAVDPRLAGGGPQIPPGLLSGAQQPPAPLAAAQLGGGGSSGGGGASTQVGPSILPQARGVAVPPDPVQYGMPQPPGYGPETTHMPYPGQTDPKGVFAPKPAVVARTPVVARSGGKGKGKPVVRIPASATASVPAAGSPWITDTYQNREVSGGALARDGGRRMGMLDLSKLFSRS